MDVWVDWEENVEERFSFEDSDRFEEDSLCSWISEPESICGNWRGWKRSNSNSLNGGANLADSFDEGSVESLAEQCARKIAKTLPFETVELLYPQIPEGLQLRIAFWSFPESEEDVRLYSCLANGSPDEFQKGEHLLKVKAVKDALQIGFHLSSTVVQPLGVCQSKGSYSVAITFDRGHITSCTCTCAPTVTWCSHIVALCLFRIHFPHLVCLRAPVSESLSRLQRDQLQKFAQYLISELPQQILPTAQRLLDELLSSQESAINTVSGAPDPTAGPCATDQCRWCLDDAGLNENIRKMLVKFCGPGPLVYGDVNAMYYASAAPPIAAEWSSLMRALKGHEPEGMWNLLSIVRELFHRHDPNAYRLLEILTDSCLAHDQVVLWWFQSSSQSSGQALANNKNGYNARNNTNAVTTEATKHACSSFCDELVVLWRLAVLNPKITCIERVEISEKLIKWHEKAVDRAMAGHTGSAASRSAAIACFPGFEPAIESCSLEWSRRHFLLDAELSENSETLELLEGIASSAICSGAASLSSSHRTPQEITQEDTVFVEGEEQDSGSVDTPVPFHDVNEDIEILCSRAEALHVHGYIHQASKLAVQLGERILQDQCSEHAPDSSSQSIMHYYTSSTLVKTAFLCGVLAEDPHCQHLAFRVGMFGLEMPRQPTRNKALEVKLANQESDLVSLLKKLPLGPRELAFICEKAELLSQGQICRGESVLPLMLASFFFDTLCNPEHSSPEHRALASDCKKDSKKTADLSNEELGFKAALAALGAKANVSEIEHPMLCEGTRRQRGDLALSMLLYCKDNPTRLRQVMRKFLDKGRYNSFSHKERKKTADREPREEPPVKDSKMPKETTNDTRQRGRAIPNKKGPRNREGSSISSPDSSSYSDSSQGSSNNSSRRGQGKTTRQNPRSAMAISEPNHGNESGSSSGVDADVGLSGTAGSDTNDSFEPTDNQTITIRVQEVKMITATVSAPQAVTVSRPSRVNFSFPDTTLGAADLSVASPTRHLEGLSIGGLDSSSNAPSSDSDYCGPEPSLSSGPESAPLPCVSDDGSSRPGSPGALDTEDGPAPDCIPGRSNESTPADLNSTQPAGHSSSIPVPYVTSISFVSSMPSCSVAMSSAAASSNQSTFSATAPAKVYHLPCRNEEWGAGDAILDKVWCGDQAVGSHQDDEHQEQDHVQEASGWNEQIGVSSWGNVADLHWAGGPVDRSSAEPSAEGHEGDGEASAAEEGGGWRGNRGKRASHSRGRKKKDQRNEAYQATEAEAHYMFELAKTVLSKAGGNVHTSLFTQPSSSSHQVGPHRALQMCAFEMGLFALGLHNRYSPNWLSRTYSSHVSWISGQAMEIGTAAIKLLLQQWEGNLTPSEAAGIADRASKSNDPAMVRSAAELGLSSLHMAHTLNPGEIDRALEQCHNEDLQLLEKACIAVEKAAYGGGVYPEKLFDVAKEWYYIYEKTQSKTPKRSQSSGSNNSSPSSPPFSPSYPFPYPSLPLPFTTPEQYVQQQMYQQVQHLLGQRQTTQRTQFPVSYPFQCNRPGAQMPLFFANFQHGYSTVPAVHASRGLSQMMTPVSYQLHSAYRVGMLALDSLARRNPDDRPAVRFARNPHCSDRIKWLCTLASKLGPQFLHRFCVSALNAVQSPYVLHDLAMDAARSLARGNPAQIGAHLRSPAISPLVQKAMTNYAQCVHHQLFELKQAEYDDFIDMLKHAQGAFLMAPGGMSSFNDLLQNIRRGHPKKKELWQKIITEMTRV